MDCKNEFQDMLLCFSAASADEAESACANDLEALDDCIEAMPIKMRGTLLFQLSRIINSGGPKGAGLKW